MVIVENDLLKVKLIDKYKKNKDKKFYKKALYFVFFKRTKTFYSQKERRVYVRTNRFRLWFVSVLLMIGFVLGIFEGLYSFFKGFQNGFSKFFSKERKYDYHFELKDEYKPENIFKDFKSKK